MLKKIYMDMVKNVSKMHASGEVDDVAYLLSFKADNLRFIHRLHEVYKEQLVVCYKKNSLTEALQLEKRGIRILPLDDKRILFRQVIPLLTKSKLILADNYYPFLGALVLHPDAEVIQLWHAVGAMKEFGWSAMKTQGASPKDKDRYASVYKKFTHFVVASKKMENVFRDSWLATSNKMLHFGNPRCDVYFDKGFLGQSKESFFATLPQAKGKKVILYAPTFREAGMKKVPMGFKQMDALMNSLNAILYVRTHPSEKGIENEIKGCSSIVTSVGSLKLEEILPNIDCLISDYSSVPFEYTLANPNGKCLFYVPDYDIYEKEVGIVDGYREWAPGEIIETQGELMKHLQKWISPSPKEEESEDKEEQRPRLVRKPLTFDEFNRLWNTKNNGMATQRVLDYLRTFKHPSENKE